MHGADLPPHPEKFCLSCLFLGRSALDRVLPHAFVRAKGIFALPRRNGDSFFSGNERTARAATHHFGAHGGTPLRRRLHVFAQLAHVFHRRADVVRQARNHLENIDDERKDQRINNEFEEKAQWTCLPSNEMADGLIGPLVSQPQARDLTLISLRKVARRLAHWQEPQPSVRRPLWLHPVRAVRQR